MRNPNYSVMNFHNFSVSLYLNSVTMSNTAVNASIGKHATLGMMPTMLKNLFIMQI